MKVMVGMELVAESMKCNLRVVVVGSLKCKLRLG
jgi:hypothetical protein